MKEFRGTNEVELIKKVMNEEQINQRELADRLGCKRQSVNQWLNRSLSMRCESFIKMVKALGYEVVLKKVK